MGADMFAGHTAGSDAARTDTRVQNRKQRRGRQRFGNFAPACRMGCNAPEVLQPVERASAMASADCRCALANARAPSAHQISIVWQSSAFSRAIESKHDAPQIAHAPELALRTPNAEPEAVPSASDAERPMPDARGNVPGSIFALTFATALLGGTAAAWPIHFAPRRPDCLAEIAVAA